MDDDSNILVADQGNQRIQKFAPDGKSLVAVGEHGDMKCAIGIAIHPHNKKIYAMDIGNHQIAILNPDLTFSATFGDCGRDRQPFYFPQCNPPRQYHSWDMAFDSNGNLYMADSAKHCIEVYTEAGQLLRRFGRPGSGEGELNWPSSIAIDSDKNMVYVTECNNHRVSVFTCEGQFLASFGSKGSGPGQFNEPHGVAVDKNGVVYVSDTSNNRLQLF